MHPKPIIVKKIKLISLPQLKTLNQAGTKEYHIPVKVKHIKSLCPEDLVIKNIKKPIKLKHTNDNKNAAY